MDGKLIIFSAPSGSGKSTLINYLLTQEPDLRFSVSATSRAPRGNERNGVEYRFLTPEEFKRKIGNGEFIEYEEVYPDLFYGTLKSEVERIRTAGWHVIFDVDVVGGLNIRKQYGEQALAIFVRPPSIEALRERLESRHTDSPEIIEKRLAKAEYELGFAAAFDRVIVNDEIEKAQAEALQTVRQFLDA
ncbi:MAG: guanylate kinase [Tannerella sp.]|jgi:guanylate kinase|nr:guanylate kinase [Tannerella sp.]